METMLNGSLYVGNLSPECTEAVIFEKFSAAGPLLSVRICKAAESGKSLGYGYVNFLRPEDARTAMDTMNYDTLVGQPVRIMWVQKNPKAALPNRANLVVKNLHRDVDDKRLWDVFSKYGTVVSVKVVTGSSGVSKGFGFVQFDCEESADKAIDAVRDILGKRISLCKYIPYEERKEFQDRTFAHNVLVKNLPPSVSSDDLVELCSPFRPVTSVSSSRRGFVSFDSRESADRAIALLNHLCLDGERLAACHAHHHRNKSPEETPERGLSNIV